MEDHYRRNSRIRARRGKRADPVVTLVSDDMVRNIWGPCYRDHPPPGFLSLIILSLSLSSFVVPSVIHLAVAYNRTGLVPPLTYPRYRQPRMSVKLMSLITTNVWTHGKMGRDCAPEMQSPRCNVIYRAVLWQPRRLILKEVDVRIITLFVC